MKRFFKTMAAIPFAAMGVFVTSCIDSDFELTEDNINTERSVFAEIFTYLKTLSGKPFRSLGEFTEAYADIYDKSLFSFIVAVFKELKIFIENNGVLVYDEKIKNALTNSKVYSKIVLLKD